MSEAVQQLILETLDKNGSIDDTRLLVLPGQTATAATQEDQLVIIAALNSLSSRDVSRRRLLIRYLIFSQDGYISSKRGSHLFPHH